MLCIRKSSRFTLCGSNRSHHPEMSLGNLTVKYMLEYIYRCAAAIHCSEMWYNVLQKSTAKAYTSELRRLQMSPSGFSIKSALQRRYADDPVPWSLFEIVGVTGADVIVSAAEGALLATGASVCSSWSLQVHGRGKRGVQG